jgi:hypothetical protein
MKTRQLLNSILLLCFLLSLQYANAQQGGKLTMWYNKPAKVWNEALPVGNGRLAAMIFGNPSYERIQLNEGTFWSGGPSRNDNPDALGVLPVIRQLIFDGMYSNAESIINQNVTAKRLHGALNISLLDSCIYLFRIIVVIRIITVNWTWRKLFLQLLIRLLMLLTNVKFSLRNLIRLS